jgi:hypothetical protein
MSPIVDLTDFGGPSGPRLIWGVILGDYRYEFHPDRALVYKGEATEHSYTINYSGCDCPSAVYGTRPCKHEKPLSYRSDGTATGLPDDVEITSEGMSEEDADDLLADLLG